MDTGGPTNGVKRTVSVQLEAQLREFGDSMATSPESECTICCIREASTAFVPCGHRKTCHTSYSRYMGLKKLSIQTDTMACLYNAWWMLTPKIRIFGVQNLEIFDFLYFYYRRKQTF